MSGALIRKLISTNKAPKPVAPYNQAVLIDRTLYVSGVLGLDKDTMALVEGGVTAEARQALTSLGFILTEAGSSYDKVVKATILLQDIADFKAVNEIYEEFFKSNYPARCAFQAAALPLGAQIEIEVIAVTGEVKTVGAGCSTCAPKDTKKAASGGCATCGPNSCACK